MATLEHINYSGEFPEVRSNGKIEWVRCRHRREVERLPQIFWDNGSTWPEANLWALELALSKASIKTVIATMQGLLTYAKWLEAESIDWWHFPQKAADRCLYRYRGFLVSARDRGDLAPSTASARMSTVIRFYRWVNVNELLTPESLMWNERTVKINIQNITGFHRSMNVLLTDLAIPNRTISGYLRLEDGLMPVTRSERDAILQFFHEHSSEELSLMLRLGFLTGMRLGTICDIKEGTVQGSVSAPIPGFHQLSVGPGAQPRVKTKMGVTGRVLIPNHLLDALKVYLCSERRLLRKGLADKADSDLAFLNPHGKPYEDRDGGHSAVNTEMSRLRKLAEIEGVPEMRGFKFHRSRATFATMLMMAALDSFNEVSTAITFVRNACLHKRESTTLEYIKFIEDTQAMSEAADKFTDFFMGPQKNV